MSVLVLYCVPLYVSWWKASGHLSVCGQSVFHSLSLSLALFASSPSIFVFVFPCLFFSVYLCLCSAVCLLVCLPIAHSFVAIRVSVPDSEEKGHTSYGSIEVRLGSCLVFGCLCFLMLPCVVLRRSLLPSVVFSWSWSWLGLGFGLNLGLGLGLILVSAVTC
jgi:hypothetical protein